MLKFLYDGSSTFILTGFFWPSDPRVGLRNVLPVLEVDGSRIFLPAPAAIYILQQAGKLTDSGNLRSSYPLSTLPTKQSI